MLDSSNDDFINKSKAFINKYPKNINGYISLSDTYENMDRHDDAIKIILDGIKENANNIVLLDRYTILLIHKEDIYNAKDITDSIIAHGNPSAITYGNIGIIHTIEGDNDNAIKYYKKSLELEHDNVVTLVNLAMLYNRMYQYEISLSIFKEAKKIENSENIKEHINLLEKKLNSSKFDIARLIELPINPKTFHILVPENFDAKIEDAVIKISSKDNRIVIIVSHEKNTSTDDEINKTFDDFKKYSSNVYAIIRPFKILDRDNYKDRFASMMFTGLQDNKKLENFYALSMATNKNNTLFVSISSTVQISEKLINFSKNIIDTICFL